MDGDNEEATGTTPRTPTAEETDTPTRTAPEPPVYDCGAAERPPSPRSDADPPGEDERYTYPEQPESLSDDSAVLSYVEAYERAYRLNDLYAEYGMDLREATLFVYERWTHEAPDGSAIARLKCPYSHSVERDDGVVDSDSPTIYAAYYIDDAVVLRAVREGYMEDESELSPDPMEWGDPLECF